ncbi:DUF7289 family protein [Halosegnis marinus]|uniref:Ig-like domain-containing protein n=1 Tax=Halosegnis marinus TaxID=3034023 RepID=A0ABD5ZLX7_9EURY|nr:Ig-like domain-containing protein [Halosegnis sp. DT85]
MTFSRDDRGLSEVLGAILVFGLVVSLLSVVQLSGVPALNEQVEFEHNARVQDDMRAFGIAVDDAAATGRDRPVDIETGVRYPPRLFLLNPGPTAGTLTTTGDAGVSFGNLRALDADTAQYLNGSVNYTTTGLVYQPAYNEYTVAPETRYENGVIYNVDDDGGVSVIDSGALVTGRRITLVTLDGDVATSAGDAVSLTLVPVSGPSSAVSVTNNASGPLMLTVETNLSAETWRTQILDDEYDTDGPDGAGTNDGRYVLDVRCVNTSKTDSEPCDGPMTIEFEEGFNYDLRMAKVAFAGSDSTEEEPAYLTKVGTVNTVQPGGSDITVELRDGYNNPVAGEEVNFLITPASLVTISGDNPVTTDANGRATVGLNPLNNTSFTLVAWYDANNNSVRDDGDAFTVEFPLDVADNVQPPTGDLVNINPRDGSIVLNGTEVPNGQTSEIKVTFSNTGSDTWEVKKMRASFVLGSEDLSSIDITNEAGQTVVTGLELGGSLTPVSNLTFAPNGSTGDSNQLTFDGQITKNGSPFDGLLIVTFEIQNQAGEIRYLTYFVAT